MMKPTTTGPFRENILWQQLRIEDSSVPRRYASPSTSAPLLPLEITRSWWTTPESFTLEMDFPSKFPRNQLYFPASEASRGVRISESSFRSCPLTVDVAMSRTEALARLQVGKGDNFENRTRL
jgi:hypothetical protein